MQAAKFTAQTIRDNHALTIRVHGQKLISLFFRLEESAL
jgi:hypothetical protein